VTALDELVPWLREQIAAVRETARNAIVRKSSGDVWGVEEDPPYRWGQDFKDTEVIGGGKPIVQCNYEYGGPMIAAHIAEHDPRTVLAQCEAHEKIVGLVDLSFNDDGEPIFLGGYGEAYWDVVRIIALAYQHRPGYRKEWMP
jgi:hypothetical protein